MNYEQNLPDVPELSSRSKYRIAHAALHNRFTEAVQKQSQDSDYRHFLIEEFTNSNEPFAQITLVDDYDAFIEGQAEVLELYIPLKRVDKDEPIARFEQEEGYFGLRAGSQGRLTEELTIISAITYEEIFKGDKPLVTDFDLKLFTYEMVPLRQEEN